MLDPQKIRKNIEDIKLLLSKRGFEFNLEEFADLEAQRKDIQVKTQELQSTRNRLSKEIGILKKQGESTDEILKEVSSIGDTLKNSELKLNTIQDKLDTILQGIPNIPHESVPDGRTEADNVEKKKWGNIRDFNFTPKDHIELGELSGLLDFEAATKITGSRFVVIKGQLAQLHRALIQFMLNTHVNEHGYTEVNVPYIVNSASLYGTGQLPKFEEDLFKIPRQNAEPYEIPLETDVASNQSANNKLEENYYLLPTAEVPVTNLARDLVISKSELPLKYVCHSPCFRSEAGSYGKDTAA